MTRHRLAFAVAVLASALVVANDTAAGQQDPAPKLSLVDQTFSVVYGGAAHFEFAITGELPAVTPPPTPTAPPTLPPSPPTLPPSSTAPTTTPTPTPTVSVATGESAEQESGPASELNVQVRARLRIEHRSDVADVVAGDLPPVVDLVEFDAAAVIATGVDGTQRLVLDVPIDDAVRGGGDDQDELDLTEAGVYPVTVQVGYRGRQIAAHTTFIEVVRPGSVGRGPFSLAIAAAVDDAGTFPTADSLEATRAQLTQLAELAERITAPIAVSLPPDAVQRIVAEDPAFGTRLRDALVGDTVLAQPDLPLDPAEAVTAGLDDDFVRRLTSGQAKLEAALPGVATQRGAWLTRRPLTGDAVRMLRNLGVQLLVVPYDRYLDLDGSLADFTDTSLLLSADVPDDLPIPIAVIDPGVASISDAGAKPVEQAVHLLAEIGAMRTQLAPDRRSLVLARADMGIPDAEMLAALERLVASHPEIRVQSLVTLTGLSNSFFLDGEVVTVELPVSVTTTLTGRVERVNGIRLLAGGAASMLPVDDPRREQWQTTLSSLLTTGVSAADSDARLATLEADVADLVGAVVPPEEFQFTIGGRSARVPVRITNNSSTALTVVIHFESDRVRVPVNDVPVVLAPNSVTSTEVEVTARTNGRFPIEVEVRSPAGSRVTEPVTFTARVTSLAGLGQLVTVGGGLVLLTWWLTYFTRRRAAQAHDTDDDAATQQSGSAAHVPDL